MTTPEPRPEDVNVDYRKTALEYLREDTAAHTPRPEDVLREAIFAAPISTWARSKAALTALIQEIERLTKENEELRRE